LTRLARQPKFGIARARTEAGPDEALLFNAEFTAPQSGALVHFCSGVLRTPAVFPQHGCNKTVLQMQANDTRRSQTAATALQMSVAAPVRARNNSELISGMKHKYLSAPSTLPPQRKTTKYPIALFNPPSHDGGYHNGLKSQVCTNNPGAQWTARPTLLSAPLLLRIGGEIFGARCSSTAFGSID